eukprot:470896-Rhodomonas_salina.1
MRRSTGHRVQYRTAMIQCCTSHAVRRLSTALRVQYNAYVLHIGGVGCYSGPRITWPRAAPVPFAAVTAGSTIRPGQYTSSRIGGLGR